MGSLCHDAYSIKLYVGYSVVTVTDAPLYSCYVPDDDEDEIIKAILARVSREKYLLAHTLKLT
ncbi:hypothetical protein A0E43_12370 [Pectobacterium cacticida]